MENTGRKKEKDYSHAFFFFFLIGVDQAVKFQTTALKFTVCYYRYKPFYASKHLCMTQKPSKVYVEHVPSCCQHYVVTVSITDSQDEGNNTPASTGIKEIPYGLVSKTKYFLHISYMKYPDIFVMLTIIFF